MVAATVLAQRENLQPKGRIMPNTTAGVVHALSDVETRRFLYSLRLSDATIRHFGLGAVRTNAASVPRLHIPLTDEVGIRVGAASRALYDQARCAACGETVSATVVARRHRQSPESSYQRCPYCDAGKKKARISWLLGQSPKFLTEAGVGSLLYNAYRAEFAVRRNDHQPLLICEGYSDVWATHEAGYWGTVALTSARASVHQLDLIQRLALVAAYTADATYRRVGIMADNDGPGRINARRIARDLADRGVETSIVDSYSLGAQDPAAAVQRDGAVALARTIQEALLRTTADSPCSGSV
jgi:DNA primase